MYGWFLGDMTLGALIPTIAPIAMLDGIRHIYHAEENIVARRYDDLAVSFGRFIPGTKKTMSQSSNISKDMKKQLKSMQFSQSGITALMVEQIVLGIDREKRSIQDKKKEKVTRADGTEVTVLKQEYSTCTHSCNIGTLKKLHEMGYINIDSIRFKKKSSLIFERFMADTMTKGIVGAIKDRWKSKGLSKDKKIQNYDMYVASFRMTDKEINLEDVIESLSNDKSGKGSSTINIDYLSDKEKKLSEEEKTKLIDTRKRKDEKYTTLAGRLIKKAMGMISLDSTKGVDTIRYVEEGSKESVLCEYKQRKEQEVKRKSWIVEHINRNNDKREVIREGQSNDTIQTTTDIDEGITI